MEERVFSLTDKFWLTNNQKKKKKEKATMRSPWFPRYSISGIFKCGFVKGL